MFRIPVNYVSSLDVARKEELSYTGLAAFSLPVL